MTRASLAVALVATLAAAEPALDQHSVEHLVDQLREQGFTSVEVTRTLLGRTRILATGPSGEREIVVNPATGEILRDRSTHEDGAAAAPRILDSEE